MCDNSFVFNKIADYGSCSSADRTEQGQCFKVHLQENHRNQFHRQLIKLANRAYSSTVLGQIFLDCSHQSFILLDFVAETRMSTGIQR